MEEQLRKLAALLDDMEANRANWTEDDKVAYERAKSEFQRLADEYKKAKTTGEKVTDNLIDFTKDTGKDTLEAAGDIVIDTVAALPNVIGNLANGRVDKIVFELGGIILGNVGQLVITVGVNGLYTIGTSTGTVIYDGISQADLTTVLKAIKQPHVMKYLEKADLKALKQRLKFATGILPSTKSDKEGIYDKAIETWDKIASAPGTAGLAFADELSFGLLVPVLDAYGVNATGYLEANPEAASAGRTSGLVLALAGGPVAAAKMLAGAAKYATKKVFRDYALRKNVGKVTAESAKRKKFLEHTYDQAKKGATHANPKLLKEVTTKVEKEVADIESALKTLRHKKNTLKQSPEEIRAWWDEFVGELPSEHVLKKHSDIYDHWTDRLLKESQKEVAGSSYVKGRIVNPIKDNWKLMARNVPSTIVNALAVVGGDMAGNYIIAYTNAKRHGVEDTEAREIAWSFAIEKTPRDLAIDALGALTKGTGLLALAPKAGRLYIASERAEDGSIVIPDGDTVDVEAGRGGRDISPKGEGGAYGVPRIFNAGGIVANYMPKRYNTGGIVGCNYK